MDCSIRIYECFIRILCMTSQQIFCGYSVPVFWGVWDPSNFHFLPPVQLELWNLISTHFNYYWCLCCSMWPSNIKDGLCFNVTLLCFKCNLILVDLRCINCIITHGFIKNNVWLVIYYQKSQGLVYINKT